MKPLSHKLKKSLWTAVCILVGNTLLAFLVAAFVMPHNILVGGTTGISIFVNKVLSPILPSNMAFLADTASVAFVLNMILLFLGLILLGKKFFWKTVASSILFPIILAILERIPGIDTVTDDPLLAAVLGGAVLGIAVGLVIRVGASTGGVDVINLVMHKFFHWPVAVLVYITDFIILGGQAIFSDSQSLMLGLMFLVVETIVLDQVMVFGKSQMQLFVVSEKHADIRAALLNQLEAGVTLISIETGWLGKQQQAVMCIIPPRKLYTANELVRTIDPEAFVTVTKIKEVRGQGFTTARRFRKLEETTLESTQSDT